MTALWSVWMQLNLRSKEGMAERGRKREAGDEEKERAKCLCVREREKAKARVCLCERGRDILKGMEIERKKSSLSERVFRSPRQPRATSQHLQQGASRTRTPPVPPTPPTIQPGRENFTISQRSRPVLGALCLLSDPPQHLLKLVGRKVAEPPHSSGTVCTTPAVVMYCSR